MALGCIARKRPLATRTLSAYVEWVVTVARGTSRPCSSNAALMTFDQEACGARKEPGFANEVTQRDSAPAGPLVALAANYSQLIMKQCVHAEILIVPKSVNRLITSSISRWRKASSRRSVAATVRANVMRGWDGTSRLKTAEAMADIGVAHPLDAVRGGELGHAAAGFCGGKYCSSCAMRRLTTTTAASPKAIPPSM